MVHRRRAIARPPHKGWAATACPPRTPSNASPDGWNLGKRRREGESARVPDRPEHAARPDILKPQWKCSNRLRFVLFPLKGLCHNFAARLFYQNLDAGFSFLKLLLAKFRKLHALLINLQSLFEGKVRVVELANDGVEPLYILFKRFRLGRLWRLRHLFCHDLRLNPYAVLVLPWASGSGVCSDRKSTRL